MRMVLILSLTNSLRFVICLFGLSDISVTHTHPLSLSHIHALSLGHTYTLSLSVTHTHPLSLCVVQSFANSRLRHTMVDLAAENAASAARRRELYRQTLDLELNAYAAAEEALAGTAGNARVAAGQVALAGRGSPRLADWVSRQWRLCAGSGWTSPI